MTAINVFPLPDKVVIITDGGGVGADGSLHDNIGKVVPIAHLACVVSVRGPGGTLPFLSRAIGQAFASYDEMKVGILALLLEARDELAARALDAPALQHAQIVVAGISSAGPDAFIVSTGGEESGLPHWQVVEVPMLGSMLAPHPGPVALAGGRSTEDDFLFIDPDRDAVRIVSAQRKVRVPWGAKGRSVPGAGGFVQVTTIGYDETITTRIVHRFPSRRRRAPRAVGAVAGIVGNKVLMKNAMIEDLNGSKILAGSVDAAKIAVGTLTVDRIKGGEISTRSYSGTSNASASVTVKEKGAVLLVGTFKYEVGKKDRTVVSIKAGGAAVNGGKWECDPGDDLKGVTNIIALQDLGSAAVPRTYELKRERGKGKITDIRLFALRVAS